MQSSAFKNLALLKDPKFYLENFCKIKGKKPGQLIPFILKEHQKDLFNTIKRYNRIIVLKARQMGFSSAMVGYFYHNTIMNPGTTTAIIGYNAQLAAELLDKIKTFYRSTPNDLKPTIHYDSKWETSFPRIDSKILVLPSTENVGRGYTLSNVLATEVSLWENAEEKMITLEASVPINGKLVVESCVVGNTIIFTDKGPRFMEDIHNWDNYNLGFSYGNNIKLDGHYGLKSTNIYYNSGIKRGYKIKTIKGYELGMSSIHKIFVYKDGKLEFIKAKDLKIGDYIPIKFGQNLWGNNNTIKFIPKEYGYNKKHIKKFNTDYINNDLAYLIGIILGDGYINDKYVIITTIDKEISDFLLNNNLGLKFIQDKGKNHYHYRCINKSFADFLINYIGFEHVKARNKKIPKIIFNWSKDNVVSFLQGLFDTDASCRNNRGTIALVSTSKKIIDVTRMLLLNFGIITSTHTYIAKPSKKVKVFSSGYVLEMNNYNSKLFLEDIGFRIKRKQDGYKNVKKDAIYNNRYIVPGIGKIIKKYRKQLGLKYSEVKRGLNLGCFFSKDGNSSYRCLNRILEKCNNKTDQKYKQIKELVEYGYYYDKIKEIVPIEENVYDFTVDDGHTVIYNGMVGHQTPRGIANHFAKLWMDKENDYVKKKYGWWWDYTREEIEIIRRRINNPLKFAQEFELAFLASGLAVFDNKKVEAHRKNIFKVGDIVKDENESYKVVEDDGWRIYRKPKLNHFYVCGVDPADGVEGGDYSAAIILDRTTGEEVAFYHRRIPQYELAKKLNEMGRRYNNALMVVEMNSGSTTMLMLKELLYPNPYFRQSKMETLGQTVTDRLGWRTTNINRGNLINDFDRVFRENSITIHSEELLNEMLAFVYDKNGDPNAEGGFHDDVIFAISVAIQGFKVLHDRPLDQLNYEKFLPTSFAY